MEVLIDILEVLLARVGLPGAAFCYRISDWIYS
jgi:hypothetical protein